MGTPKRWDTTEQAVSELIERRDDFDSVTLRMPYGEWKVGNTILAGPFLEVHLCDGSSSLVSLDIAESLLNDGILSRLRIPLKLIREAQSDRADPDQA
jgi:hypothetical protein